MAWSVDVTFEGLPKVQLSRMSGLTAGFYIEAPEVQAAIRARDPKVFDGLNLALDHYEEIAAVLDFSDGSWAEWAARTNQLGIEDQAKLVLKSEFSNALSRSHAQEVLNIIEKKRRKCKAKQIKASLITERRSNFQTRRPQLMLALINRDGCECKQCSSQDDLTIDHIIPLSKGGSDDLDNLELLCQSCNSRKRDHGEVRADG